MANHLFSFFFFFGPLWILIHFWSNFGRPNFRVFVCERVGGGEGCQGHYNTFAPAPPGRGGGCYPMIGLSLTAIPYQFTTSFLFLKIDNSNILPKDTFDPLSLAAQTCCLVCNMVTI